MTDETFPKNKTVTITRISNAILVETTFGEVLSFPNLHAMAEYEEGPKKADSVVEIDRGEMVDLFLDIHKMEHLEAVQLAQRSLFHQIIAEDDAAWFVNMMRIYISQPAKA